MNYVIIWLVLGVISLWIVYHSTLYTFYRDFGRSYWDLDKENGSSAIRMLLELSPIYIAAGPVLLVLLLACKKPAVRLWFTTKNKQK